MKRLHLPRFSVISSLTLIIVLWLQNGVSAQTKVILKLDDLGCINHVCQASPVMNDLMNRKIKAAFGIIANRLDKTSAAYFEPFLKATNDKGQKLFEIWHHGLDHSSKNPPNNREFEGTTFEFQTEHFQQADLLVQKYLGVRMHTFGAPYNATDSNTVKVISNHPAYKVLLFCGSKSGMKNGILYLNNRVNMESATGVVNFDYFVSQFQANKNKHQDFIVLQGHPNQWDAARLAEFNKILDYLIAAKCEFVLPYEYYLSVK